MNSNFRFGRAPLPPLFLIGVAGSVCLAILLVVSQRVEASRAQFYAAKEKLGFYRSEIWRLEKMDRPALESELLETLKRFPMAENANELFGELSETAKAFNVSVDTIKPGEFIPDSESSDPSMAKFGQVPIEIHLRGNYEELALFMARLRLMPHGVLRIVQFEMAPSAQDKTELALHVLCRWYVKKQADEPILDSTVTVESLRVVPPAHSRFEHFGRNPFTKVPKTNQNISVQGIIFDPPHPLALVNGELWKIGDEVNGYRLIDIKPERVVFLKNGEKIEIQIKKA